MTGTALLDRYELLAELGQGGLGVVYRAHDRLLDRAVAVKLLSPAGLGTQGRARLLQEARAAARLNHPNIIDIFDAGEAAGTAFIVMELVEGESLHVRRPSDLATLLDVMIQVCRALEHAHGAGIIHRDLKPENILITPAGVAKLADFGLARSITSRLSTEGATLAGTVYYLAPEQALGQPLDGRTDLYALGVVLYELTTGQLPFTAADPVAVIAQHLYSAVVPPGTFRPDLPPALDALILQLLAKTPAERPASASAVRATLEALAAGESEGLSPGADLPALGGLALGRLVGRERDLSLARSLWLQVLGGQADERVLLITGEAGVGKTPLVRAVRTLAAVTGGRGLVSECYPEGSAPYAAFVPLVREALALAPAPAPAVQADLAALLPELAPAGRAEPRPPAPGASQGPAEQSRLFDSVAAVLAGLAAQGPLLLVIEDIHWADAGTLFMLRHLARRARAARLPLLLLVTYRDAEPAETCCLADVLLDFQRERLAQRLKLGRYNREQTQAVLAGLFSQELPASLVDALYAETEGNLFFLEEICKALVEDGQLVRADGRWQFTGSLAQMRLPQSVRETLQARLTRLPEAAQEVLRVAAVIGREFDFDTLHAVCDPMDEDSLVEALEAGERAQLIAEVRGRRQVVFAFTHALIVTTLRESAGRLRLRRMHRRVAAALEGRPGADAALLAYHFAAAGDDDRARDYHTQAARAAAAVYANEDALQHYTAALELAPEAGPERFDLLGARTRIYELTAQRDAQRADVEAMLTLAQALGDQARQCDALLAQADLALGTDHLLARAPARSAEQLAYAIGDPVRAARALQRQGEVAWMQRELPEARRVLEQAIGHFRQAGLAGEAAACLHSLSLVLGWQGLGDLPGALAAAEEAVRLSRQAGDRRQQATALRRLAITRIFRGAFAEGLREAREALALHRELGDRVAEARALGVIAVALAWLHQTGEAEQVYRESIDLATEIGAYETVVDSLNDLIWTCLIPLGKFEQGLAMLADLEARAPQPHTVLLSSVILDQRVALLAAVGDFAGARALLRPVVAGLLNDRSAAARANLLATLGTLAAELGDLDEARSLLAQAQEVAEAARAELPIITAYALVYLAHLAWLAGDPAGMRDGLAQVQQAIGMLDVWPIDLGRAHNAAARLCLALADPAAALPHAEQAVRLVGMLPGVPHEMLWTESEALASLGRSAEARASLERARNWVQHVAGNLRDPALRRHWLEDVRHNREILAAWSQSGQKR